jgi:hypothetical protein
MDAHVAPVIRLEPVGVPCGIERSETTVMYRIGKGRSAIHRDAILIAATAMLSLPATDTLAQDTQRVFFPSSAENTKYTQQHLIEVGDVGGHHVRVFEILRTFPKDPPIFGGLALKEEWNRGVSDYTDNSGAASFYGVYVLENGDKFFAYSTAVSRKAGAGLSAVTVGRITGGTGKFANMRGTIYTVRTADPAAGINEGQTEVEYVLGLETDARDARKEAPRPPTARPGQR